MSQTYPIVLYATGIKRIGAGMPPLPVKPQMPAKPVLQLIEKIKDPIISAKPKNPGNFVKLPPQKIEVIPLFFGGIAAVMVSTLTSVATKSFWAGLTAFILVASLVAFFGIIQIKNYSKRQQDYKIQKTKHKDSSINYPLVLAKWEQERDEKRQEYERKLRKWEKYAEQERKKHESKVAVWQSEVDQLEKDYQLEAKSSQTPQRIMEWRDKERAKGLKSLSPYPLGEQTEDKRGYAEFPKNCSFSKLLTNYFSSNKIHILRYMKFYTPDFAYIDTINKLYIDVEIDEPYTPRQYPNSDSELKLTHCIGQDNKRDEYFQDADWFVVRFSEKQVLFYSNSCCKCVAQLIYEFTRDEAMWGQFANVPDLQPEPCWTEQEATIMANKQERLRYQTSKATGTRDDMRRQLTETEQQVSRLLPPNATTSSRAKKRGAARAARRTEQLSISSSSDTPTPISLSLLADCPYCGNKVKSTKLESHKLNRCPKRPA